ncbi:nitroreductase family protein [Anaerobacillus sp. MEB173]|uniref:nitroreductase family protein n=1 Tax=Anaerobacillus sp. MEB173 TaxID=3383345 RepID=UPI003F8F613C
MEFNQVVSNRREITSFSNRPIPSEVLDSIVEVAILAPTGNNLPSREFIVVQERKMLDHLSEATPYVKWLKESQAAIVITGRPNISKYWLQDGSISSGYIWLSAVNEGVGCAFGAILNTTDNEESEQREGYVRDALTIPKDRRILAILGLGYVKENPKKKQMIPKNELVHYETFE